MDTRLSKEEKREVVVTIIEGILAIILLAVGINAYVNICAYNRENEDKSHYVYEAEESTDFMVNIG